MTRWGTTTQFTPEKCNTEMVAYAGTEYLYSGVDGDQGSLSGKNTVCLTDPRDGQAYRVRKMPDGNCWMIDNLKYAGGHCKDPSKPPYYDHSHTSTSYCSTTGEGSHPYKSGVWSNSITKCGYLYPWETATVGSGNSDAGGETGQSAICPAGWTLPANGIYGDLNSKMIDVLGENGLVYGGGLAFQAPYSGLYNGSDLSAQGYDGCYWGSTQNGASLAHCMFFNSSTYLHTNSYTSRMFYVAVRCYR
jgi:uncharacterized protein (TIGR02145 family)